LKSNAAEALSMGFLVCWLIGDMFYIIAAICKVFFLNNLGYSVLAIGIWYAVADLILIFQTVYYRKNYTVTVIQEAKLAAEEPCLQTELQFEAGRPSNPPSPALADGTLTRLVQPVDVVNTTTIADNNSSSANNTDEERLNVPAPGEASENWRHRVELLAQICAWFAFACFVGARLPQLYKNVSRTLLCLHTQKDVTHTNANEIVGEQDRWRSLDAHVCPLLDRQRDPADPFRYERRGRNATPLVLCNGRWLSCLG
jgi:hypothetical protein